MPEQFRLQQLPGKTGAIQIDKCLVRARAIFMKPARQHAFPGSCFTKNKYGAFGRQEFASLICKCTDSSAVADEWVDRLPNLARSAGHGFVGVSLFFEKSLEDYL